jgi:hypothetical protein
MGRNRVSSDLEGEIQELSDIDTHDILRSCHST